MGASKAISISTRSGAMKEKPVPRIADVPDSEAEFERLPLLVHGLAIVGPPLGILEILHGLVLLAGRKLPELVLGQQWIELGAGAGVGDHTRGLGLVLRQRHLVHQLVGGGLVLRLGALDDAEERQVGLAAREVETERRIADHAARPADR